MRLIERECATQGSPESKFPRRDGKTTVERVIGETKQGETNRKECATRRYLPSAGEGILEKHGSSDRRIRIFVLIERSIDALSTGFPRRKRALTAVEVQGVFNQIRLDVALFGRLTDAHKIRFVFFGKLHDGETVLILLITLVCILLATLDGALSLGSFLYQTCSRESIPAYYCTPTC